VPVEAAVRSGVQHRHGRAHKQLLEHSVALLSYRADLVEDRALSRESRVAAVWPRAAEKHPTDDGVRDVNERVTRDVALGAGLLPELVGASPFPDNQTAPCWVEISHDGQYLFTVNTASGSISSYSIAPGGSLGLAQATAVSGAATPEDARLSPDGRTLWFVDPTADAVSGFAVFGGTLTELSSSPTQGPVGAAPSGVVVT
jgi:Lactonase, 7-bladed beta-propeller